MNKQESDILNTLLIEPYINQRILSEASGHSLGVVNRSLKNLIKEGYVDEHIRPTEKAKLKIKTNSPKNAITCTLTVLVFGILSGADYKDLIKKD